MTNLSTSVGYVDNDANLTPYDQPYGVAETRTAAFKGGRVLYTKTGDPAVLPRALAAERDPRRLRVGRVDPELERGPVAGVHRQLALRAWSDNRLYRFSAPNGLPRWGTRTVVDNGDTSGIRWSSTAGLWAIGVERLARFIRPRVL